MEKRLVNMGSNVRPYEGAGCWLSRVADAAAPTRLQHGSLQALSLGAGRTISDGM